MKKLFLVLSLMLLMVTAQSQALWFNTTYFRGRMLPVGEWTAWEKTKMSVSINTDTKHIVIYSKIQQIIDWEKFTEDVVGTKKVYTALATDANYKIIQITLTFYDLGSAFLKVSYSDFEVEYELIDYE